MLDFEQCWQAVLRRDRAQDGQFVTAVRSTGIYCRPSCPARHPRREQVSFFATPEEARAAGYRACKRCRPDGPGGNEEHAALAAAVCRYLEAQDGQPVTLADLAAHFHLSPFHLQRTFRSVTGVTPRQYAEALRSRKVKEGLRQEKTVTGAIFEAGYMSSSGYYEKAGAQLGMTPGAYRRGGEAMQIVYTLAESRLGPVLVAATGRGICAVSLGESATELETRLAAEYPRASLRRDDETLQPWLTPLLEYLDGTRRELDLPLDIQATAFQQQVWQALRAIPYGNTRTYAEVAAGIGHPGAARAVARACASNRAALLIPCHRVVGAGGKLSGYRWGIERKRALLDMEQD
jgi:AraC family transcriptional regulator of adaptative response/methylated-DNA-[protein]-cysteine methyltransferase